VPFHKHSELEQSFVLEGSVGGRPRRDKGGCFFGCEHDGTKSTRSGLLGERPNLRGRRDDHLPLAVHVDESQTPGHRLRTPGQ